MEIQPDDPLSFRNILTPFYCIFQYICQHPAQINVFHVESSTNDNTVLHDGFITAGTFCKFRKDGIDQSIGCDVSQYALIVIGSAFLLLFLIITRKGFTSCNKLLVVQGKPECLHKTEAAVDTFFSGKVHVSMRNVTESSFELVYSIGEGILDKAAKENQMDISEKLIKIDGVKRVNVVDQKDELSQ